MEVPRSTRSRWFGLGSIAAAIIAAAAFATPAQSAPAQGAILHAGDANVIAGSYIVVLRDSAVTPLAVPSKASSLVAQYGGSVGHVYSAALRGFEVNVAESAARRLATHPDVAYVQANRTVSIMDTQSPVPSWGLDRVDQRALPLNNSYTYPSTASGVKSYTIDTGILTTHNDFGGRAIHGRDTIDNDNDATDCHGHGTHVSGTIGGTAHGLAKGVTLVAVRVLNCSGSGSYAQVIAGIDWVTNDHQAGQRAVANMSLGGPADTATDTAVTNSIADGVVYGVAAGNENGSDACGVSPARTPNAITVGSTTSTDARSSFSNIGTCLDIFAPGSSITSAWIGSNTATNTISGTSMATPHVVGASALVLATNPGFTPQQVRDYLVNNATNNVVTSPGTGSPNKLLFVVNAPAGNDFSMTIAPTSGSTNPGGSTSATISTAVTNGSAETITFSASGIPAGVTVSFSPGSVTAGGSSTVAFATTGSAAPGTYPITVTGTAASANHSVTYSLTINGPAGCSGTNAVDVQIPDNATVNSAITISGCPGNAGAGSTVEVHIVHTYIGDLVVSLIAPDGSAYVMHNRTGGSADNINQTYTVNLAGEVANGTWTLRVQDAASADVGYIDTWTLNLVGGGTPGCTGTNGTNVNIPDNTTVNSAIAIAGCTGNASATSTVEVHIVHTYIGDLIVSLIAPDGSAYVLHNRAGGSADNINQTYTVNLSTEARNGTWTLRVQDAASIDTGFIDSWTLTL